MKPFAPARAARWTASTATTRSGIRSRRRAEQAVDGAIAAGLVSRELPFVRREGVRLVEGDVREPGCALRAPSTKACGSFYAAGGGVDRQGEFATHASPPCRTLYRRNVFPGDEGDLGHLSRQHRPHHVDRLLPLPRRLA